MAKKNQFVAGFRSEYLASTVGKIGVTPVGMMSLRLNPKEHYESLTIMLDRPSLERMVEDLSSLLNNSPMLAKGERQGMKLAEVEAIHQKLTD